MNSFYMPTKVLFGYNCVNENKELLRCLGTNALIVTGKSSAIKSGALEHITSILKENNTEFVIYDKIRENPTLESVQEGRYICKQNKCDFIIAIGGGSPIDAAKAIAILAKNNIRLRDIFNPSFYNSALPLVAIPTTSGTGTEATPYSVITDESSGKKAGFGSPVNFPDLSFCDPSYTSSMSPKVTRDTGIDALSHLLEGLYSNKREKLTYPLIHKGIKLIIDNLEIAINEPDNLEAREAMMQASLYGGMVISHSSTTLQHSIGYPITTVYGVSHGLANGIFMKPMMELYYPYLKAELDELFQNISISKEQFYDWLDKFNLSAVDMIITEEFIKHRAPEVMDSRNMALNPLDVKREQIEKLYRDLIK